MIAELIPGLTPRTVPHLFRLHVKASKAVQKALKAAVASDAINVSCGSTKCHDPNSHFSSVVSQMCDVCERNLL